MTRVARLCIDSILLMCFTKYGFQTWQLYSKIGHTRDLYAVETPSELFGPKVPIRLQDLEDSARRLRKKIMSNIQLRVHRSRRETSCAWHRSGIAVHRRRFSYRFKPRALRRMSRANKGELKKGTWLMWMKKNLKRNKILVSEQPLLEES